MKWLDSLLARAWGPKSKFKLNDCVHTLGDETLMIVKEIHCSSKMKSPLIKCNWYEEGNVLRTNLFPEETLIHFDWESYWLKKNKSELTPEPEDIAK